MKNEKLKKERTNHGIAGYILLCRGFGGNYREF